MVNKSNNEEKFFTQGEGLFNSLKSGLTTLADAIAEKKYQDSFLSVVTLKDCIQFFKDESQRISSIVVAEGFVLSVKKNYDPKNENDRFVVIQALLGKNNKPIVINGETVSRTMHTKTIDDALIRALNGSESKVFTK